LQRLTGSGNTRPTVSLPGLKLGRERIDGNAGLDERIGERIHQLTR